MGVKRDIDSGRKDALGRAIKVSANAGQKASAGAIAKAPSVQVSSPPNSEAETLQYDGSEEYYEELENMSYQVSEDYLEKHKNSAMDESAEEAEHYITEAIRQVEMSDLELSPANAAYELEQKIAEIKAGGVIDIDEDNYEWMDVYYNNSGLLDSNGNGGWEDWEPEGGWDMDEDDDDNYYGGYGGNSQFDERDEQVKETLSTLMKKEVTDLTVGALEATVKKLKSQQDSFVRAKEELGEI